MSGIAAGTGTGKIGASRLSSTFNGTTTLVAGATNANGMVLRSLFAQFDAQYGNVFIENTLGAGVVYLTQTQTAAAGAKTALAWCGELLIPAGWALKAYPRDATQGRVIASYDLL